MMLSGMSGASSGPCPGASPTSLRTRLGATCTSSSSAGAPPTRPSVPTTLRTSMAARRAPGPGLSIGRGPAFFTSWPRRPHGHCRGRQWRSRPHASRRASAPPCAAPTLGHSCPRRPRPWGRRSAGSWTSTRSSCFVARGGSMPRSLSRSTRSSSTTWRRRRPATTGACAASGARAYPRSMCSRTVRSPPRTSAGSARWTTQARPAQQGAFTAWRPSPGTRTRPRGPGISRCASRPSTRSPCLKARVTRRTSWTGGGRWRASRLPRARAWGRCR
mmetsp:Transcript_5568/g.16407  ORF Transcript_5568/g.16407 Transcript_5568/m.16407 type:complete len:274 (+) Transcript_5568:777-1598(+)